MAENRIRYIRRVKGFSGTKIAEELGISPQYYYDIEKGKRNLSAEMATRLAGIFGVSTDYLLGRTDDSGHQQDENLDEDIRTIQRAARRMTNKDRKKMMELIRLTFEDAFTEDDEEDDDDL